MKAVVVMAREPKPNVVKTRLTPPLDPVDASRLYNGFLLDKIEQVESIKDVDRFVAYTPEASRDFFENITQGNFTLISQKGKDLGERLSNVSNVLFEIGYDAMVILDSDTPNLPSICIKSGLEALEKFDLVLGPCEDGGYYLVGLSSRIPKIFQGIPWSTSSVTKATIKKARSVGKSLFLLERWYDVDTIEDLKRLKGELDSASDDSNRNFFCRNTYNILSEIL